MESSKNTILLSQFSFKGALSLASEISENFFASKVEEKIY